MKYKRLEQFGIDIIDGVCIPKDVDAAVRELYGAKGVKKFNDLFGIATCPMTPDGQYALYPWDVEVALDRLVTGRKLKLGEWD